MNTREQAIAYISGAIATYSLRKERGELEDQVSMYDFLAKTIPEDLESDKYSVEEYCPFCYDRLVGLA